MKHFNNLLTWIIMTFVVCSCRGQEQTTELNKFYSDTGFPDSLKFLIPTDINPDEMSATFNLKPDFGEFTSDPFCVFITWSHKNVDSIQTAFESMYKHYEYGDECNVVINKFEPHGIGDKSYGTIRQYAEWIKKLEECNRISEALPHFNDLQSINHVELNSNSDIFVIESKYGKYFGNNLQNGDYNLPEGYEHGFSRGYIIGEDETLSFWLIIW